MFSRAMRWLASAAAMLVFGAGVFFWLTPGRSADAFDKVLENAENADTLHLRVRLAGGPKDIEIWHTNRPNRTRWDEQGGNYRIADGSKYWVVNEKANEARRAEPPAGLKRPVTHLLDALGVPAERESLLAARPVERVRDGGVDVLVYRAEVPSSGGKVRVEARVAADTRRLRSLTTKLEKDGKVEPLGELTAVAYDEPIGAEKFAIADTLTEDGRIGNVSEVQGIVSVKPVMHERWTPVRNRLVLKPGDWVRTDARGANATALRLVKKTGVVLGPKTLVELLAPRRIRISEGEIQITASAAAPVDLLGPDGEKITVGGKQFFRVEKEKLVRVGKEPAWLLGFRGATTAESLGSLVANVDGRNVPLTVGYHKVSVDIRDQIARTVIEESFVNHTDTQLEGVFYFPLPQDASISGFGMWVGNNLVEADVVEAQRAREIYETILRERRDPGLLEWSGGNLFKARVFPIFAHSEKRIKITYTQVLPLQGSRYRYGYALQSELLQQHPLHELSIDVKVNSVTPLKSVTSPTHPARTEQTRHSAHVEFTAQEYTPTRDFEVVVETDGRRSDLVMVPHRRGDDGYFMLQLTPPGVSGDWDRLLLSDGEPVRLLILADTSASIDARQRATQATFIGSLLAALTPRDTFNLGTCDVTCAWAFAKPVAADANNVAAARAYLAGRTSLGWTNLDLAFAEAQKQSGPKTHVVYVGDGIVTAGDGDPVAFTKRLRRRYNGHSGTFHAVTLGSTYEPGVMRAIASLGGGSVRKITGEQGPQSVALELLDEIARPSLRDVKIEFKGLKVARVYPEELPNVPAGTQQIVLGRYLPEGKDQAGEVIVTGTQAGKPVRFSTRVALKGDGEGNSFVPRLWARMHLDSLLEQGTSDVIRDEIIALSEEYQIITPYTSFLVLETDADRERFKVKRRFQMRDGEKFFAAGRDNATFDLTQRQMKKAGAWRIALRRSVLRQLAGLGRDPRLFQPRSPRYAGRLYRNSEMNDEESLDPLGELSNKLSEASPGSAPESSTPALNVESAEVWNDLGGKAEGMDIQLRLGGESAPMEEWDRKARMTVAGEYSGLDGDYQGKALFDLKDKDIDRREAFGLSEGRPLSNLSGEGNFARARRPYYGQWVQEIFPRLRVVPGKANEPKSTWPAPAQILAKSLLRTDRLAQMTGGVEIVRQAEWFDARWADPTSRYRTRELFSARSWFTRSAIDGGQTLVSWCDAREHGVFSEAFLLGRLRASTPADRQPPPLDLSDHSLSSLERAYSHHTPTLEAQGKDRTLLVLKHPYSPLQETRVLIDTARHVILSVEDRNKGKVTDVMRFDDFVEAAGSWWARRIERTDANGKRLSLITQTVKALTADGLEGQINRELAGRAQVQFLHFPLPSVRDAKKALAAGKVGFDEQFVLLLHFISNQQWTRALDHLQQAEKLAADKPGLRWLRSALLFDSRRHDELRKRYQDEAAHLAKKAATPGDDYFLAEYVVGQAARILQANEMLALLDVLRPLYQRQPGPVQGGKRWLQLRVSYLSQAEQPDAALRLQKQLANDYPRDYRVQEEYARSLATAGDYPAAYAWLTRVLANKATWLPYEEESLRNTHARLLQQQGRYPDLVNYLAAWVQENPDRGSAYEQYLSALIRADRVEKADALAARWLKEGEVPGELAAPAEGRLNAAVELMLGHGYDLYTNRIQQRWLAPLARAALFFARHETQRSVAERIMSQNQFQRSDEYVQVRKTLAGILTAEIDRLPADQVWRFVYWVQDEDLAADAWKNIAAALRQRWSNEANARDKDTLGQAFVRTLSSHGDTREVLAFLRLQLQKAPAGYGPSYASRLFEYLLAQPWSAEIEGEAFALFDRLSAAEEPEARLFAAVGALHRLTDTMVEARYAARMKTVAHPEKLTRVELRKKQEESRRLAREGFADRLRQEAAKRRGALARWINAERLYFDVSLDRNLKQAAAECWEFLGAEPRGPEKVAVEPSVERILDDVLRQRYLVTLTNLAARKGAAPALAERLLKYLDRGIGDDTEDGRWKLLKQGVLIALDRTKELEQALRQWVRVDGPDSHWRVALGYLMAEQGRVAEAVREFEAVESAGELGPADYRALAGWYMVRDDRARHDRAAAAVYKTAAENSLYRSVQARLNFWTRRDGRLPSELDGEVLRLFAALFERSASPQSYLHALREFYQASHDFRLLSVLPDAVVGHTAARVYPFLQGMQAVLDEVRDEATADELVKRIVAVRKRAGTAVDLRALDLLEVLVERRAAEVQNQPGPHLERSLAALRRAFKRQWAPGEPRLMADFLASLGRITQVPLAKEQLRELKTLHGEAARGSLDRLHIGLQQAMALRNYNAAADATDLLQAALTEFQDANAGVLPVSANNAVATLVTLLEGAGHFAKGEKYLLAQFRHPAHQQQRVWLTEQLYNLYHHALMNGGDVASGSGLALYQALTHKIQGDLPNAGQDHRYQLIHLLCQVYRTAHEKKLADVSPDLRDFAFKVAPPILKQQTTNHESLVSIIAQTLHDLAGPRDGIAFLLDRVESEPRWLRYRNQDGWGRHGSTLGTWRKEAKDLGGLEGRLFKLVLKELRRDLETREQDSRNIYSKQHYGGIFWEEKEADFAKVAEEVLKKRGQSGASAQHIAEYFYRGLGHARRAIEILSHAYGQKLLDEMGKVQLVDYLHRENRYGESIPVLQPLVERHPDNLPYRVLLMRAYFRTGHKAELLALLKQTDAFFHQDERWTEQALSGLAHSCLENELYQQSVAYYKELIPLHERTQPRRGIGDGTLGGYYADLANGYAGLQKTAEAVDAACGAVVAWGPRSDNRTRALDTLKQVLTRSPDLDAFVAHFDQQKQDSAVVRKALGQAYRALGKHAEAIKQLRLAAELQPNDAETYQLLIAYFDQAGDKEGAIRQLLQAVQLSRRDIKLYQELGRRYEASGRPNEAERAYTSIVEVLPAESESHALLAEVREGQNRWTDAIAHWERVARIRALEPTGLLKLAAAQIREKKWDRAAESLRRLKARTWPARFGDVPGQIRTLEEQIAKGSKQ